MDFITKAKLKHGDKYDYSKLEYVNVRTSVLIICRTHGEFRQMPSVHLKGGGCSKCFIDRTKARQILTKDQFITKAKLKHGDKYDYSKLKYKGVNYKEIIICQKHGEFKQFLTNHLKGSECKRCSIENSLVSKKEFIRRSIEKHGDKYDYSKYNFNKGASSKSIIICPIHGEFTQLAMSHMIGFGCKYCSADKLKSYNVIISKDEFIKKASEKYNNKYNYSLITEITHEKLSIICPKHGIFQQFYKNHLKYGCKKCAYELAKIRNADTINEFTIKANKIHNNKYDYSKFIYDGIKSTGVINCPVHGEFKQRASSHTNGDANCPKCSCLVSKPHQIIIDYIKSIYDGKVEINDRELIKPYEIDILIPDKKIGVEINGLRWHSFDYQETKSEIMKHSYKYDLADNVGYKLIQFLEDEVIDKQEIIFSKINYLFGKTNKIFARKCEIKELNSQEFDNFMIKNHLQGKLSTNVRLGLIYDNKLICAMGFNKHKNYDYECTRFANEINTNIVGGASRLFNYFLNKYNSKTILTYADRRYSNGNLYKVLGFNLIGVTDPGYCYVKGYNKFSRQQFQKHKLYKKLQNFNPKLSESQNMFNNGYRRLWDAGHWKFLYKSLN